MSFFHCGLDLINGLLLLDQVAFVDHFKSFHCALVLQFGSGAILVGRFPASSFAIFAVCFEVQ